MDWKRSEDGMRLYTRGLISFSFLSMSRLIVKNLPSYVTPEQLRKHFQQKGAPSCTLTDVKVAFKRDGSSRRFGFVGFKTDTEAEAARNWFDRTFIDSSKISVSLVDVSLRHLFF
jgi:multiple RNA-binding domain-containing protein 1